MTKSKATKAMLAEKFRPNEAGATKPSDYIWIARWGQLMASMPYYIQNEQLKAFVQNAPLTAIYRDGDGIWHVAERIENAATKEYMRSRYPEFIW